MQSQVVWNGRDRKIFSIYKPIDKKHGKELY